MKAYFLRRLLLIFPTMIGITLLVFTITRFVPGGAMDRMLQQAQAASEKGGGKQSNSGGQSGLSEDQLEELEEQFGLDKPTLTAYGQWLGIIPKEIRISKKDYGGQTDEMIGGQPDAETVAQVVLSGDGRVVNVKREGDKIVSATFAETGESISSEKWQARLETEQDRKTRYLRRNTGATETPGYAPRAIVFQTRVSGLFQGDLGRSLVYQDRVVDMMLDRMPVAIYFGLLSAIITYVVCLPLGILKALKHRTFIDSASSVLIFIGYSIPGFALGAILLVHLGARANLFPLFGLMSADFDEMDRWSQVRDIAHHTVLPLICYLVSGFAMLTMLTKNSLMDNLAADYVRTAVSKGAGFRRAVFKHAFRNSMIPIATSLGGLTTIFVSGSMLVERVFDIQGFGLLQYQSIIERDMPVIMGTLTVSAFLLLLGNIISDFVVAMVDPRVKFE